jgi:gag-polyprotein putative aspartyl protease
MHDGYRNFVQIRVKNRNTRALLDSGAARSCISEAFFRSLNLPASMLKAPGILHLVSANKSPMTNLGIVHLNLYIAGLSLPYQFRVLSVLRELS